MTALEDLWYGNIRTGERTIRRGSELDNLLKLLCQNEDDLMKGLSEKQKGLHSLRHTFATNLVNGVKQPDGTIKCLTPRQAGDLLGHSTSQITEMYYVKRDNSRLVGITDSFEM